MAVDTHTGWANKNTHTYKIFHSSVVVVVLSAVTLNQVFLSTDDIQATQQLHVLQQQLIKSY